MSSYPEPTEITPIFVPQYWIPSEATGGGLSQAQADARYAQLAGNQTILGEETFQNGIRTDDLAPNVGSVVDVDGDLNLTSGNTYQINGVDLIASQTGQSGKYLVTNGTSTLWNSLPINPIVNTGVPSNSVGLLDDVFISSDLDRFYHRTFPTYTIRSNPTFTGTVIPVGSTRTYTTIAAAITAATAGDILELDQETFTITSIITVNKSLEIRGTKATTIITGNLATQLLDFDTSAQCYLHDVTITNANTGSNAGCLNNKTCDNVYVDNVIINTNEFGYTNSHQGQFKISNCTFNFVGTPDSHRYIYTTRASGDIIVQNNTFQAVNLAGTPVSRFMVMTAGLYTNLTKVIVTGNSESTGTVLSQFFLQDSLITATLPIQFFFDNNSASLVNSGILTFFATNILNSYQFIAFNNNTFGGNSGGSGTTGIVKLDLPSAGSIGSTLFVQKNNVYTGGITNPSYLTASTGSDLIAYNTTVMSFPNITLYASIWIEIIQVSSGGLPAGSDTQVQFNDGGAFGGDAGMVYNKTTDVLTTTGGYNTTSGTYNLAGTPLVASQTGQSGKYLTTNGTSTSWGTVSVSPAGSNTQIQFNNSGAFGADADLTYNSSSNELALANGTINLTGGSIITSTTSLLMHFDSSPPVDSGFNNVNPWTTNGTISISSLQSRFGSASALFATNSWFQATSSLANNYEMTIECWIYPTATPVGDCSIIEAATSGGSGFAFGVANNAGNVRLRSWTAGPSQRNWDFPTTWASILNTWVHISWNRSASITVPNNNHLVTLNGVKSTNNDVNQGQSITWTPIRIGRGTIFTGDFAGYVDELRLSLGLCRYTTTPFTPPSAAFGDLTTGGVQISGQIVQNGSLFPNSVNVTASSSNASFFPVMVASTTGYQQCVTDSDLTYNPSTNFHTMSHLTLQRTFNFRDVPIGTNFSAPNVQGIFMHMVSGYTPRMFFNKNTGGGDSTELRFGDQNGTLGAMISVANNAANEFRFFTGGNNERMRILSTGEIGIGTTTPAHALSVVGNVNVNTGSNYLVNGTALVASQTGNSGRYLTTNGTSTSWATVSTTPAGSNTQVQFNDGGVLGADSGMFFDKSNDVLTLTGGYNLDTGGNSVRMTNTGTIFNVNMGNASGYIRFQKPLTVEGDVNVSNSSSDPLLNLVGTASSFGTIQFQNNLASTQATINCSTISNALNLDFQSLTNGLRINSSGVNKFAVAPSGDVTLTGDIVLKTSGVAPIAGELGYVIFSNPLNVNLTSGVLANISSFNLSAGTWSMIVYTRIGNIGGTTNITSYEVGYSTANNTLSYSNPPYIVYTSGGVNLNVSFGNGSTYPMIQVATLFTFTTATTINFNGRVFFTGGTDTKFQDCYMQAIRIA